jgi:hypothetical protein
VPAVASTQAATSAPGQLGPGLGSGRPKIRHRLCRCRHAADTASITLMNGWSSQVVSTLGTLPSVPHMSGKVQGRVLSRMLRGQPSHAASRPCCRSWRAARCCRRSAASCCSASLSLGRAGRGIRVARGSALLVPVCAVLVEGRAAATPHPSCTRICLHNCGAVRSECRGGVCRASAKPQAGCPAPLPLAGEP